MDAGHVPIGTGPGGGGFCMPNVIKYFLYFGAHDRNLDDAQDIWGVNTCCSSKGLFITVKITP